MWKNYIRQGPIVFKINRIEPNKYKKQEPIILNVYFFVQEFSKLEFQNFIDRRLLNCFSWLTSIEISVGKRKQMFQWHLVKPECSRFDPTCGALAPPLICRHVSHDGIDVWHVAVKMLFQPKNLSIPSPLTFSLLSRFLRYLSPATLSLDFSVGDHTPSTARLPVDLHYLRGLEGGVDGEVHWDRGAGGGAGPQHRGFERFRADLTLLEAAARTNTARECSRGW